MFAEERRIVVVEATLGLRVGTRHGSGLIGSEKMDPWTTLMRQHSGVVGRVAASTRVLEYYSSS